MNQLTFSAILIVCMFISGISEVSNRVDSSTPEPLVIDSTTTVQPISENTDLDKELQYTRTIKFYYRDPMKTPIALSRGGKLVSYCSDSTVVTFVTALGDTVSRPSVKRMSCQILAVVNFEKEDINALLKSKVKTLTIMNCVTDNSYTYELNTDYFQRNLIKWKRN